MENFSKTKTIVLYCIFALIFAVCTIFTFVPMQFGSKDFMSSFGAIHKTSEIGDSISAVYNFTESEATDLDKSIKMIGDLLEEKYGTNTVNVSKLGSSQLKVEVAKPLEQTKVSELETFFTTLAGGRLEFRNNKSATVEKDDDHPDLIVIDGWTEMKSVSTTNYKGQYGITVEFTKSGKDKFVQMSGQTCYMFIDGEAFPSSSYNSVDVTSEQTSFTFWLQDSLDSANYYYEAFRCGLIPINLDAEDIEITYTNADNTANYVAFISLLAVLVILIAIIIVKFRIAGLLFSLATLLGDYVLLFFIQLMPWASVGMAGVITISIVQIIQFALVIAQLSQFKAEYSLGKSLVTSIDDAFNKFRWVELDVFAVMLIAGLGFACLGKLEVTVVGTIFSLSAVLFGLVDILFARYLVQLSFAFGEKKPQIYALPQREENVNE